MTDDLTLQARVMEELTWIPNVDAAHIGVSARNGVVTLSGIVNTLAEKLGAERAARRVKGVQGIAQEIVVRPPSAPKHADTEIAERAVEILNWDVEVPHRQIQVEVEHGVVMLTGTVPFQFQKQAAEHDVGQLGGVVEVINRIEVRPEGEHAATDPGTVRHKIEAALRRAVDLEASHININVSGNKVTLQGQVKTWWERSLAEDAAWSAPGVTQVDDQLRIGS
jgi:osmotically-inducible protein OsmY